jgi:hypothetical protein
MSDKMEGIRSLNTSHVLNINCQKNRADKKTICSSCYSYISEKRYKLSHELWKLNYNVLSTHNLSQHEVPILSSKDTLFRFNAHGDLINRIHYNNLIKIVRVNPGVKFALWTKNLKVIYKGKGIIKLDNLQHIYSDLYLDNFNVPELPKGFDKIFRVYTTKAIKEKGIEVNCSKHCITCELCYKQNDIQVINEQIKSRFK